MHLLPLTYLRMRLAAYSLLSLTIGELGCAFVCSNYTIWRTKMKNCKIESKTTGRFKISNPNKSLPEWTTTIKKSEWMCSSVGFVKCKRSDAQWKEDEGSRASFDASKTTQKRIEWEKEKGSKRRKLAREAPPAHRDRFSEKGSVRERERERGGERERERERMGRDSEREMSKFDSLIIITLLLNKHLNK